jgi:CubicO group peptidase (beta-lactamase class C family)
MKPASFRKGILSAAVQPFVDRHVLAGAVMLVANREKILALESVGFADVAAGQPLETNALFWIASQTKPITGTALMMLMEAGLVGADDPVEKYLPEFKDQWLAAEQDAAHILLRKPRHPITVRNILTHTSGMPFSSAVEMPTRDRLPLRTAVRSYAMTPLLFEPDTQYQYCNAGINTAAAILEVITGKPYATFLQERLLGPLGMRQTTFLPRGALLRRLARVYKPNADSTGLEETTITQLSAPLDDPLRHPMPAGGLFSTARDVARFCRMILNGGTLDGVRYLSEASVKAMTSKQTPEPVTNGYGFGWATDGVICGHGGALSTNMSIDTARGLITVFLVQHAGFPGDGAQSYAAFKAAAVQAFSRSASQACG